MKTLIPFLAAGFAVLLLASAPASASILLRNDQDVFWDASGSIGQTSFKAKYKESPENGRIDQTLEVELQNAPRGVQVFLSINGATIGSMVTDATGRGVFRLDRFGVMPDANGRPDGARIETGDVIRLFRGNAGLEGSFVPRP
ncbi:MAG TPA: hypothetical protein VGC54_10810 [Planctomycetota bacterium]